MEYELKGNMIIQQRIDKINFFIERFETDTLSYRTQGLKDKIGYEIEFNLPVHPAEVQRLMINDIIPKLLNGFVIEDNLITNLLTGAPVLLMITTPKYKYYDNEKVLRIIFSDESFKLPSDKDCHPIYAKQID